MNDSLDARLLPFKAGEVLGGKFRIERVLGQGGMGVVVQAMHLHLDQRVALKFLLPDALTHPDTVARFAREARAAAKIRSEHVARVIDVGTLDTGSPYIVMEYLEGEDLSAHLKNRGPLSLTEATGFVLQACEALAEAHAAGVVHRDLKPANLFLARYPDGTPCVKILDFGISKLLGGTDGRDFDMTRTTAIMGSPYYMSPEQMRSTRSVDARADIWALGVILYELVAGRVPFDADTMPELCAMVLQDAPPRLGSFVQTGSPTFEAVVLRCLEKDVGRRFPSIADLANALSPFAPPEAQRSLDRVARLSGNPPPRSGGGLGAGAMAVAASSAESLTHTDFGQTAQSQKSSRGLLFGVVALALAAAGASAFWLLRPAASREVAASAQSATVSRSATEAMRAGAPPPESAQVSPFIAPAVTASSPSAAASAAEPPPSPEASPVPPRSLHGVKAARPATSPPPPKATLPVTPPAVASPAAPALTRPPSALDGRL